MIKTVIFYLDYDLVGCIDMNMFQFSHEFLSKKE